MINKTNIENLNFVIKKNLNQNNYLQLDFPYLDQYFDWYKFRSIFNKHVREAYIDELGRDKLWSEIVAYPYTYITSVINNPIDFKTSINSPGTN